MAKLSDREEQRRRFAAMGFKERRGIVRAVNRGQMVDNRKDAPIAVMLAHRQMRLWRWAWIIGPVISLIYLREGWQVAVVNSLFSIMVLGAIGRFWYLRAQRAEAANTALAKGRKREAEMLSMSAWEARRLRREGGETGKAKDAPARGSKGDGKTKGGGKTAGSSKATGGGKAGGSGKTRSGSGKTGGSGKSQSGGKADGKTGGSGKSQNASGSDAETADTKPRTARFRIPGRGGSQRSSEASARGGSGRAKSGGGQDRTRPRGHLPGDD